MTNFIEIKSDQFWYFPSGRVLHVVEIPEKDSRYMKYRFVDNHYPSQSAVLSILISMFVREIELYGYTLLLREQVCLCEDCGLICKQRCQVKK